MAPVPGTITVNFISNYAGGHRVCWRINGVGAYDCTTIVACTGGGAPCQAIIPVTVDNNTCVIETFDGYVQAVCEVEGSLNNRIPFSVIFTPTPDCNKYDVECTSVGISAYNITDPGDGYTIGSNPPITIVGGGGSAAAAYGVVGDGGLLTFTISNGGAGYLAGGSGVITGVPAQNIVGIGVGGVLDVTVTLGVITGVTVGSADTDPGTGYGPTDTFDFNNSFFGGVGAGVIITVATVNTRQIQYVVITNNGSGYSSIPTATFPTSPITRARVTAILGDCVTFDFGNDCDGNAIGFVDPQPLAFVYKKCSAVAPVAPAGWVVTQNGCCYDCVTAVIQAVGSNADVSYTDCVTGELITATVVVGVPLNVCVVDQSWYWDPASVVTVNTTPGCP